ncbi:hypothetical protein FBY41_2632 [Humibacillus xanthopallidus]|uniref:Uncharacterized protein n=2 Tax=Humibacillus xanthopallidus TaxID=412689 RepID=A0A543HW91_9MICO|nr:hypothetical protein FBY41_2632 [Humibacillus xanthopallidus]
MTTITALRERVSERERSTALERWLLWPRSELGFAVSGLGQRVMRLGNRLEDAAPDGDEDEAWNKGVEYGRRMRRPAPARGDVEALLTRLGIDTSEATMAKLGYASEVTE